MGQRITLTIGNDSFQQSTLTNNAALIIRSLAGDDTIILNRDDDLGGSNDVSTDAGNDIVINHKEFGNIIRLGDGDDTYVGLGFGSFSTDLRDTVYGGAGNDKFAVQTFHSDYFGGLGNDVFHSVGWQNTFNGGAGSDTISYLPRSDDSTLGNTGVQIDLAAGVAETGAIRRETLISIENVIGSSNGDVIFGSAANNRITGDGGFDEMTGDAGRDTFVFTRARDSAVNADFADIIMDFTRSEGDRVAVNVIDANTGLAGNQAFAFITTGFTGHAGELRFAGGFVQGDITGDGVADFRILMNGVASMQASDFVL